MDWTVFNIFLGFFFWEVGQKVKEIKDVCKKYTNTHTCEEDTPLPVSSRSKSQQELGLRLHPGARNSAQVSTMSCRGPSTWTLACSSLGVHSQQAGIRSWGPETWTRCSDIKCRHCLVTESLRQTPALGVLAARPNVWSYLFLVAVLRCHSHTLKSAHVKYIILWMVLY